MLGAFRKASKQAPAGHFPPPSLCRFAMPELPEVETTRRGIAPGLTGLTATGAIIPTKAWLEGKTMFMGVIPVQLEAKDGGWQGAAQVGSCTTETMEWLLNIEWSNGQRQQLTLGISP